MKKQLLLFVTIFLPMVANADPVEIDGIFYNLISKIQTAEVTENPNKYSGEVTIPKTVTYGGNEYNVTSIGREAFSKCVGLTSITIPNSVTTIDSGAFYNCFGLTSVTIPNSVTIIAYQVFYGCSGLTSVTIPNSVTTIKNEAFAWCSALPSITIPNGVTSIRDDAFYGCSSLTSITIPISVTEIGESAFMDCNSLTSVHISSIEAWCNISFADNPLKYGGHLYLNGEEIKDLVIPNSVTSIGFRTFYGCSGLTSVTIPNSVTSIGFNAFSGCTGLTTVTIPNSVTDIGNQAFAGCSGLTSITIPNGVTIIQPNTFQNCSGLTSVIIPNSVTDISFNAFSSCSSLTSVTIGSGVTQIGDFSFSQCPELTDVYCLAKNVPSIDRNDFQGSYIEHATLHVPSGCVDAYKAKAPWNEFKSIVEYEGTGINDIENSAVTKSFDVYDLNGRKILIEVTSLDGLPNGVYIVNSKKILKK